MYSPTTLSDIKIDSRKATYARQPLYCEIDQKAARV